MANQDPLLDVAQFIAKQNNFYLHFVGKPGGREMGDLYRTKKPYQECLAKHPEFEKLASELQAMDKLGEVSFHSSLYQEKLYEAYQLMHPYAEGNWELFR